MRISCGRGQPLLGPKGGVCSGTDGCGPGGSTTSGPSGGTSPGVSGGGASGGAGGRITSGLGLALGSSGSFVGMLGLRIASPGNASIRSLFLSAGAALRGHPRRRATSPARLQIRQLGRPIGTITLSTACGLSRRRATSARAIPGRQHHVRAGNPSSGVRLGHGRLATARQNLHQ